MHEYLIGDVLEKLKNIDNDSIDLSITSPPYNKLEKHNGGLVSSIVYEKHVDNMDEENYQKWQIEVLNEIYRVLKPGGSFFYNHKIRYLNGGGLHPFEWISKSKFIFKQEIIWDRTIAGNIRGWRFWQTDERIYWLYKPLKKGKNIGLELHSKDAKMTSIWKIMPEGNNIHPAPFPIELPTRIICSIQSMLNTNDILVLDPFAGSGTTALAAEYLNARSISIELSQEYKNIYDERRKNASKDIEKVKKELSLHKVEKTYQQRKKEKNESR